MLSMLATIPTETIKGTAQGRPTLMLDNLLSLSETRPLLRSPSLRFRTVMMIPRGNVLGLCIYLCSPVVDL